MTASSVGARRRETTAGSVVNYAGIAGDATYFNEVVSKDNREGDRRGWWGGVAGGERGGGGYGAKGSSVWEAPRQEVSETTRDSESELL